MRRIYIALISFFILFFSSSLWAQSFFIEGGLGLRWEEKEDGSGFDQQGLFLLSGGYTFSAYEISGEFMTFSDDSQDASIEVGRRHYSLMAWGKYKILEDAKMKLLAGAGLGFFWEKVTTQVLNLTSEDIGSPELQLGLLGSYYYSFAKNWSGGASLRLVLNTNNSLAAVVDTLLVLRWEM